MFVHVPRRLGENPYPEEKYTFFQNNNTKYTQQMEAQKMTINVLEKQSNIKKVFLKWLNTVCVTNTEWEENKHRKRKKAKACVTFSI